MTAVFVLIVGVLLLLLVGFLGWYSVQSLRQARLLGRPVPLERLKDELDRPVAVSGTPEPLSALRNAYGEPVLWTRSEDQVYRRSGKSGHWSTVNSREDGCDFYLHFPEGGRALVTCEATEVHGKRRTVEREGFFSRHRTVHHWLPVPPTITVVGRLALSEEGATLVKDPTVGMLVTPSTPGRAAFFEYLKGGAGLLLAAGILAGSIAGLVSVL